MRLSKVLAKSSLLFLTALVAFTGVACAASTESSETVGESTGALGVVGVGAPIGPGRPQPPVQFAPIPVSAPLDFMVTSTTSSSVSLSWTEAGTNTTTTLYRQSYDLSGNAVGDPAVIATYQSLPAGTVSCTDAGTVTRFRFAGSELQPDHQYGYQIVEQWGTSGCFYTQGGDTCASSPSRFGYTRSAFEYPAGRIQLRVKVSSVATAAAPSDHINVSLADGNSTWLDSTQSNFTAGSNITYDLLADWVNDRSDINNITITTPDSDGLCINELELDVDGASTFFESFGSDGQACQWVWESSTVEGNSIVIPFAALRSSTEWQDFAPNDISPTAPPIPNAVPPGVSNGDPAPVYFGGFDAQGLLEYLDAAMGDRLRNPANGYGSDARLVDISSTTRIDNTHLHVQQYIDGLEKDGAEFFAGPSYDLVIHNDASCGSNAWCMKVENASGNTSLDGGFIGVLGDIPFLNLAVDAIADDIANSNIESALAKLDQILQDPPTADGIPLVYCFPADPGQRERSIFQGSFDAGSLSVCTAQ